MTGILFGLVLAVLNIGPTAPAQDTMSCCKGGAKPVACACEAGCKCCTGGDCTCKDCKCKGKCKGDCKAGCCEGGACASGGKCCGG